MAKRLEVKINQGIVSALGRKLYESAYGFVVLRELIQNSLDAGSTKIDIRYDSITRTLVVWDNGRGIDHVVGLLDTIGESDKSDDSNTIGGFGLAKLAIFGCQSWSIESKSGTFYTGFNFDENATLDIGTKVTVTFNRGDIDYSFYPRAKDFIRMIDRRVEFRLDGEILPPYQTVLKAISDLEILTCTTLTENGHVVVRVNGLVSYSRYMPNLNDTIILDYKVTVSPYDETYPLTSNRDSFRSGTTEFNDYENKTVKIQQSLESDRRLSEMVSKKLNQIVWRGKKYVAAGLVTSDDFESASMTISTYERYIKQIGGLQSDSRPFKAMYGLTDEKDNELGAYHPGSGTFLISKNVNDKGEILSIAIHEYTHSLGYIDHNQTFANTMTAVLTSVMNALYDSKFRR